MFDAEFRYRIPNTWVELRGEYVRANFGSPVNLRANNDGDPTNNVGRFMPPLPSAATGTGASRVQITKPSGNG